MSAGSFILACMGKTRSELVGANLASAAKQHEIPEEWARHYLDQELNRTNRNK